MTALGTDWNVATCLELVAAHRKDRPALICGQRRLSWGELDAAADRVAAGLVGLDCDRQTKVAQLMGNCIEYLESVLACCKAALVPVNTNYRYGPRELTYLWNDADVEVVLFHGRFVDAVATVRAGTGHRVRQWIWVDDSSGPCPPWAIPYERLRSATPTPCPSPRTGDDLILMYTGGTTGHPKGVMWRQDDLVGALAKQSGLSDFEFAETGTMADYEKFLTTRAQRPAPRSLICPPLMHSTGLNSVLTAWLLGGSAVLTRARSFDPGEVLDTVEAESVTQIIIVGDAFGRPLVAAFDDGPMRDLSSLRGIVSSGAICSDSTKAGLARFGPRVRVIDSLGSSEAIGVGNNVTGQSGAAHTFVLGPSARVIDEQNADVEPGSGTFGRLVLRGRTPLGYYKDAAKSAQTFQVIDGVRWVIPGDIATVEADGSVRFLGRGSGCINTGGEKVFPEEVEEALKSHPAVTDAAVVGLPDSRFGETVAALVHADPMTDPADLTTHVRERLAGYKLPRRIAITDSIGRADNGKLDYPSIRRRLITLIEQEAKDV